MTDLVFDTPEKVKTTIDSFRSLLVHPGWILFKQIADANIEVLREQLENGIESETKADVDRIRDKLKMLREMCSTPEIMIKKLEDKPTDIPSSDPYQTVDEFREEQKKQKVDNET